MTAPLAFAFICAVVSVHDGDTFSCESGIQVRLFGAAAVELKEPNGLAQRDWLKGLILGQRLTCSVQGTSYGRMVSKCWIDRGMYAQDVAAAAVSAGAAADCPLFSHGLYSSLEGPQTLHVAACGPPVPTAKPPTQ